jgi:hypothetical protein
MRIYEKIINKHAPAIKTSQEKKILHFRFYVVACKHHVLRLFLSASPEIFSLTLNFRLFTSQAHAYILDEKIVQESEKTFSRLEDVFTIFWREFMNVTLIT